MTLIDPQQAQVNHVWPHFLPGGRSVLFTIVTGSTPVQAGGSASTQPVAAERIQIAVLDLDTNQQKILVSNGSDPRYAPSGHIVYGLDGALWAVGFDADRLEVTTQPVPVLEDVNIKRSGAANFGLSAEGAMVHVAGSVRDPREEARWFVWVDRDGNEEATAVEARGYQEFSLSPDGAAVATIVEGDVVVYDLASGTPTRLTFDPAGAELYPTWTPDGRHVVFAGSPEQNRMLLSKAADGSGAVEPLMESDVVRTRPYDFSPDGQLVFRAQDGLTVLSLEDPTPTLLWENAAQARHADVSPDGRWLAYELDQSDRTEVLVRPFPNVNDGVYQISTTGGGWPLWNPAPAAGHELRGGPHRLDS